MLDIFCAAVYSRVLAIWVQKPISVQDLSVVCLQAADTSVARVSTIMEI